MHAVSPKGKLTEVQHEILLGLYFSDRALEGLGRAEQPEWEEKTWRESMRSVQREEQQLAGAEARDRLVNDALAEGIETTIVWEARPYVETGTRCKLMDEMAGSIHEQLCHPILGEGALTELGGQWAPTKEAGFASRQEGVTSAEVLCMSVDLGSADDDLFEFRVSELTSRIPC